jgi:lipoyl(octanoyl) transferase
MVADECLVVSLGCVEYRTAWAIQKRLSALRTQGIVPDLILFLEHPSVYTFGYGTDPADLLLPREGLEALGAEVVEVDRGGRATYHGPGQLVGYPIINLHSWGGPKMYVRALEAALVMALEAYGIHAFPIEGLTGVWTLSSVLDRMSLESNERSERKIAAIGVRISRGVTTHGFALNVTTDLGHFRNIIPCGVRDREVTSMQEELGRFLNLGEVEQELIRSFSSAFSLSLRWATPEESQWLLEEGLRSTN